MWHHIKLAACLLILAAAAPGPGATIARFQLPPDPGAGITAPLRIFYSDGASLSIPPEAGAFTIGGKIITQSDFDEVQRAPDNRTIGWLADYMMCSQSYPCPLQLVLFQYGHKTTKIEPVCGTFWFWTFEAQGRQVAAQSGYPHGDATGAYGLYSSATGRQLATYDGKGPPPAWVKRLQKTIPK